MSRTRAIAIVVAALVVASGFAGVSAAATPATDVQLSSTPAQQVNASGNGTATVTVSASGQARAQPDTAVLRVSSIAVADNSSVAAERLTENVSQLRDALLAANLSADQVRTVRYDLFRQDRDREQRAADRNRTRFVARQTIEIRLNNTSRAGEIVDIAVGNGASEVDDVTFTLSEATRQQLQRRALTKAVEDARAQAEAIAAAAGLELAGVRSVSTGDRGGPVVARETAAAAQAGDAATTIESGPVTVTASVTVTYNATASE